MPAFKLKAPVPTEDQECQNLLLWAHTQRYRGHRLSNLLLMIPNGAYLGGDVRQRAITMNRMKRTGFRAGVFDYLVPIPRKTFPGLWLEIKRRSGWVVSNEQLAFKADMVGLGWACEIAKGWEEAKIVIDHYLKD